ncbi:hypothetical protein C2E23DRAFT_879984 [Lenzites betulinus]|nr:hypothetical protein C2E23DRAFT_879984 [Lenzites betulinus]
MFADSTSNRLLDDALAMLGPAVMEKPAISPLFCYSNADVILRSCDGVNFHLHKDILGLVSPFFEGMFDLPAPAELQDTPQVVDVMESTDTLEDLLLTFYPGRRRQTLVLSRLRAVIHAAEKYDMLPSVTVPLHDNLKIFLSSEPLRVYAIACLLKDVELARTAAKRLLQHPDCVVPSLAPPEYYEIPAIAIWNVHKYREKCAEVALEAFKDRDWILSAPNRRVSVSRKGIADTSSAWVWLACRTCAQSSQEYALSNTATGRWGEVRPRAWWQKYYDTAVRELSLRPVGATVAQSQLLRTTIAEAATCKTCGPIAALELYEYAEELAKRIETAISKIDIVLPFADSREHA